jgi:hypothetical protein
MSNVVHLPSSGVARSPIGHVIRTGESSYRQLESLHAEGRLPATSVILDASKVRFQREFIAAMRASQAELILDTRVAELSELGRYGGAARSAPWALKDEDRPFQPSDFSVGSNLHIYGQIARCAVEAGMTAVLVPTHFLREGAADPWLDVDVGSVARLRAALDREGGSHIGIDYPLILPHTRLQDADHRARIIERLRGLPFDNLVVRLSGFGASAMPLAIKRTFAVILDLHSLGRPVLLDYLGGLVGLSAVAFGYASGLAHGIGERDAFDARDWDELPRERDPESPFGRAIYIPLPGFDRSFKRKELEQIANSVAGRRLIACQDRNCCGNLSSLLDNPRSHIAYQKFRAMGALADVPDSRRVGHFLDGEMRSAERKAGDLARLVTGNETIDKAFLKGRKRIDSMARMYETLAEQDRAAPLPMIRRVAREDRGGRGAL